jgi:hypothetical protein
VTAQKYLTSLRGQHATNLSAQEKAETGKAPSTMDAYIEIKGPTHHPASADAALFLKSSVPAWNLFGRGEPNPKLDTERGRQHGAEIANAARSGLVNFICHHQFG